MNIRVLNQGASPIARGTGVKISGSAIYQQDGRVYPVVVAATAADSGISSVNVLIAMETLTPNVLGSVSDDDVLVPFDCSSLGVAGSDVYLSDAGALASSPGSNPIRAGEVVLAGSNGAVLIATTTSRTTTSTAGGQATGGPESKASGALSPSITSLVSVSGTVAFTLADGTLLGQRKRIRCTAAGSTPHGTLTPATPQGFATIEFNVANQCVDLEWNQPGNAGTKGWYLVGVMGSPTIS